MKNTMRSHLQRLLLTGLLFCTFGMAMAEEPEPIRIDIVYTNDIGGGIGTTKATFMNREFPPIVGGVATAARYICCVRDQASQKGRGFLLLDAGDCFQGTPVGTLTKGKAVIEAMNLLGYDAMAIGNHEYDEGVENLRRLSRLANFPMLSANTLDAKTGKQIDYAAKKGMRIQIKKASNANGMVKTLSPLVNMKTKKNARNNNPPPKRKSSATGLLTPAYVRSGR